MYCASHLADPVWIHVECRKLIRDIEAVEFFWDIRVGTLEGEETAVDELTLVDAIKNVSRCQGTINVGLFEHSAAEARSDAADGGGARADRGAGDLGDDRALRAANHFGHPDRDVRRYYVDWFKTFADIIGDLGGASVGTQFAILTYRDYDDPQRRQELIEITIDCWAEVAAHARAAGLSYVFWEPIGSGASSARRSRPAWRCRTG